MSRPRPMRRLMVGIGVALLHILLLFAVGFGGNAPSDPFAAPVRTIKLSDIRELPPPPEVIPEPVQNTVEKLAETMIETTEPITEVVVDVLPVEAPPAERSLSDDDFLPQHKVTQTPVFDQKSIITIYPPVAQRSGIEGTVYLELFIDKEGFVRKINVLKEDPLGRGFGEAAVKAFEGKQCRPALADGEPVAVRYRYPVRFRIK